MRSIQSSKKKIHYLTKHAKTPQTSKEAAQANGWNISLGDRTTRLSSQYFP